MKISQSQLKTYKSCRRLYELKYIEGLEYNKDIEPLKDGTTYHGKVEEIYENGTFGYTGDKTDAMAVAYEKYIYPQFKVSKVETWFEVPIGKHTLFGRLDGIAEDGLLVEHKTTSSDVDDEYIYNLQWDEQILCYMLGTGKTEMYYTICKKPTIRQKKDETSEEFFARCCKWYDEDTEHKIRVIKISRTQAELDKYKAELEKTIDEIEQCTLYYHNTANCSSYGRRCVYSSVCLCYNPKVEYVDFTRNKKEKEKGVEQNELF